MVENVKTLGWIGLVRAAFGAALGWFLLARSMSVSVSLGAEPWDATGFQVVGGLLLLLSVLRLVQGIAVLKLWGWGRRLGVIIGGVDLVNLVGFPLSTILGLYALVVYSHGETVSFFASRRSGKAGASSPR